MDKASPLRKSSGQLQTTEEQSARLKSGAGTTPEKAAAQAPTPAATLNQAPAPALESPASGSEMPALPDELQEKILRQFITSPQTTMPGLARGWSSLAATSRARRESMARLAKDPDYAHVDGEIKRLSYLHAAKVSAEAIEAALPVAGESPTFVTRFVVPSVVRRRDIALLRNDRIAPAMMKAVLTALGEASVANIEIDFGSTEDNQLDHAQAPQDPADPKSVDSFDARFTNTCWQLRSGALPNRTASTSRLTLNLDKSALTNTQLDVLILTLEDSEAITGLSLRNTGYPVASLDRLLDSLQRSAIDTIDLTNCEGVSRDVETLEFQLICLLDSAPRKVVDLSRNSMSHTLHRVDAGILATAQTEKLILRDNGLDDSHVELLVGTMGPHSRVTTLDLRYNHFTAAGKQRLLAAAAAAGRLPGVLL